MARRSTLLGLSLALLLLPGIAHAQDPDPQNSILPPVIVLVGKDGTIPDPHGQFSVTVRDLQGNPVITNVYFFYDQCAETIPALEQVGVGGDPCTGPLTGTTNSQGIVTFKSKDRCSTAPPGRDRSAGASGRMGRVR